MKIDKKQVAKNIKNWRFWLALPHLLPLAIFLVTMYVFGLIIMTIGALLMQPMNSNKNLFWYKDVLRFVKEGEQK